MIPFIVLALGSIWITVNIFLLPFYPWTEGLYRPWLLLRGLLPYRDHLWNRGMIDISLLAAVYKIIGVHPISYQLVVAVVFLLTGFLLFGYLRKLSLRLALLAYSMFIVFLFPLFSNAEIEEILVGFFALCTFFSSWELTRRNKPIWLIWAGLFSGLSLMTKQTSGVLILVMVLFLWKRWKWIGLYSLGVLMPVAAVVLFLWFHGALNDYIQGLLFVATIYKGWAKAWGINTALNMIGVYMAILVPFLLIARTSISQSKVKHLLSGFILALFVMLLPSYWSYRLVASFPLLCIGAAFVLLEANTYIKTKGNTPRKMLFVSAFIVFLISIIRPVNEYRRYILDNGFSPNQYLVDYSENELAAARWLRDNTEETEKVFNMANNIIMMRANRLPFNRYVGGMPIDYLPFAQTTAELISKPPKVVVYDRRLIDDWPELSGWGFLDFLRQNYTLQQEFDTIGIYTL
ncbi:glycosyltransferase family 39 protein [Candidatus Gottesmanbacteria bacterium]|nr:glycosyltransferase family 39 protein [Candidatus Gottesmanbacteria bacterium]